MENTLPPCPIPNAPKRAKQGDLQMDVATTPELDSGGGLEGLGQGSYHTWNGQHGTHSGERTGKTPSRTEIGTLWRCPEAHGISRMELKVGKRG